MPHLSVTFDSVLNTSTMPQLRRMSLSLDNTLPVAVIRFGSSDKDEVAITCYLDSCTAINTVNSLLHMWIMTAHPNIVASRERFDDKDSFQLIRLDCTVPSSIDDKNSRKFSAVVTYMKRYTDKEVFCSF